jgi:homopolymeric O-antigen transport system permease protein
MASSSLTDLAHSASGKSSSWQHRAVYSFDLTWHLVQRDFLLRYTGSTLGVLWSVLLPLAQLLVLVFLFQKVVPLKIEAYPAYVFSGLLPWTWFSSCLNSAGGLFFTNRDLLRRPNFTPALLIVVNTLSNLLSYLASLPVLFGLLFFYGKSVSSVLLILPLLLLIQSLLTIGLGLMIATCNVFYRDVQHIISVVTSLLFYLTPVFYRPDAVATSYRIVLMVNPMAVLVNSYRAVMFDGVAPEWELLFLAGLISAAVCGLGYFVYHSRQHHLLDAL